MLYNCIPRNLLSPHYPTEIESRRRCAAPIFSTFHLYFSVIKTFDHRRVGFLGGTIPLTSLHRESPDTKMFAENQERIVNLSFLLLEIRLWNINESFMH